MTKRVVRRTMMQPIGKPIEATLFYTFAQAEQKLEKKLGVTVTRRFFSRPIYLGVKVGSRAVPYVGWSLLAYDAYTILRD